MTTKDWIDIEYQSAVDNISTNNIKIKQKEYLTDGAFPVIDQGSDLIGGYTNDVTKVIDCSLPAIVFGDHTKIVKLIKQKFAPGADGIKVLVPHKFFDSRLFAYFTQILTRKIPSKGYARHFQYLTKSKIPLPPLPEQRAIVGKIEQLFSDLDNGIANLKQAREQLKVYRQAVLKKAFEGELTKEWREQQTDLPSADKLLKQIKTEREKHYTEQLENWTQAVTDWETKGKPGKKPTKPRKVKELTPLTKQELAELPKLTKYWAWEKLGNVASRIQIGPFGSQLHKSDYVTNGIPIINPKRIRDQKIHPHEKISKSKLASLPQYILNENDILLGRRGEMGRSAPITNKEHGWLCGTGSLFIRMGNRFNAKLFSLLLSERRIVNHLTENSRGTTMINLNSEILNNLPIQVFSSKEQEQIVSEIESRLSVCDNVEANIEASLQRSEALRQSILKKAFEGKLLSESELTICRAEPDYEPAEKLLKRIKSEKEEK